MLRFDLTGLSETEKQKYIDFTQAVNNNQAKIMAQPTARLQYCFLLGLASTYGITEATIQGALKNTQQVEQARKAAIDNSPSGIRKALPILAYMLGSYILASMSPGAFTSIAMQTLAKDLLAELLGPKAKALITLPCLALHAWGRFAPDSYPLPFNFTDIVNSEFPAIEEAYGSSIYFAAPVLTGLYNVSKGSISGFARETGRVARAFFEACEDFSDVIHGQGHYFDDEPTRSPACSSSQP